MSAYSGVVARSCTKVAVPYGRKQGPGRLGPQCPDLSGDTSFLCQMPSGDQFPVRYMWTTMARVGTSTSRVLLALHGSSDVSNVLAIRSMHPPLPLLTFPMCFMVHNAFLGHSDGRYHNKPRLTCPADSVQDG